MNQTPRGTRDAVDVEQREDEEHGERREHDAAERGPHVARRDVAPPAVVEAREREDGQLDRDDEQDDLPVEVPVVVDGAPLVEAEAPREPPGGRDDRRVDGDLPERWRLTGLRIARRRRRRPRAPSATTSLLHVGVDAAPHRQREVLGGGALRLGQGAGLVAEVRASPAGGAAASRSTTAQAISRSRSAAAIRSRSVGPDDVHVVHVAGLVGGQLDGLAEPELRVAGRRLAPCRVPAGEMRQEHAQHAAWIASSREFVPTSSKVCLSREPWKRSIRTRSATASSVHATSPPSPSAKRFFVGKKLNVEQTPVVATPARAERLRGVLDQRHAQRGQLGERRRPAEEVHRHDRLRPRGDPRRDVVRIEVERDRVDVREHRRRADAGDRLGGGVERERRADHLVAARRCPSPRARARARRCRSRRRSRAGRRERARPRARTPRPPGRR